MSDDCPAERVNNQDVKLALTGLCVNFSEMFALYRELAFRDAQISTASLGQFLRLDQRAEIHFRKYLAEAVEQGAQKPSLEEAFNLFRQGVAAAEVIGVNDTIASVVPDAEHLDFGGMQRLIYSSVGAKWR